MNHRSIVAFAVSALAAWVGLAGKDAEASARRVPASICFADTDNDTDYVWNGLGIGNASGSLGARARVLHCGLVDNDVTVDGLQPESKVKSSGLFVDGYDGNSNTDGGQVTVRICQTQPWTTAFFCSLPEFATTGTFTGPFSALFGTGTNTLTELQNTAHQAWYPEIEVTLPDNNLGESTFYGYVVF
jgi:hypothetical protein